MLSGAPFKFTSFTDVDPCEVPGLNLQMLLCVPGFEHKTNSSQFIIRVQCSAVEH